MNTRKILPVLLSVFVLVVAACGRSAPTEELMMDAPTATSEAMMDEPEDMMASPTTEMMDEPEDMMGTPTAEAMMDEPEDEMMETATPEAMMGDDSSMMEAPAWFSASLTDARSGQSFTINDFKGKIVLVETMAVWCTTCFRQQQEIMALHAALGEQMDFVSLSLDIDPNEDAATLAGYLDRNSFDWTYAVAPAEVSREIGQLYGDLFLNPPSAPMFIIDRNGEVHPLPFGVKSADDLQKALEPYLNDGM